ISLPQGGRASDDNGTHRLASLCQFWRFEPPWACHLAHLLAAWQKVSKDEDPNKSHLLSSFGSIDASYSSTAATAAWYSSLSCDSGSTASCRTANSEPRWRILLKILGRPWPASGSCRHP